MNPLMNEHVLKAAVKSLIASGAVKIEKITESEAYLVIYMEHVLNGKLGAAKGKIILEGSLVEKLKEAMA